MKKKALIATLGVMVLLTAGCVPMERELRVDQDLLSLRNSVTSLEENLSSQRETDKELEEQRSNQIDGLSKRQADFQANLVALRVEVQTVRGLLDDASARRREDQETVLLTQKDAALRLGNFDSRLAKMEKELIELRTAREKELPVQGNLAPEALYEQGRDLVLNKGDTSKARTILEDFIKARPQSELLPNAYYWIGEAYYSEKNYENAIVQFQDLIDKFPTHLKASASLYKQALAFESLGEAKKAKALLKRLIDNYPVSDEAKKAKERIGGK